MGEYTYRVDVNRYTARIEVAVYDATRWDGAGGAAFGLDAEVFVSESVGDGPYVEGKNLKVEVSQGSIGSVDIATANQRADVYAQAIAIARFIEDALRWGGTLETVVGEYLKSRLVGSPTPHPFRYLDHISPRIVETRGQRAEHPSWTEAD